jgi:CDP-paratose 2-epimerase
VRVLVTGGAGFVGANVAVALARTHPDWTVVAFDNLRRAGSELSLARLGAEGVVFVHGDVREPGDLEAVDQIDALVECSAEASVLAGLAREGELEYLVRTNLVGAHNCLALARRHDAAFVFLSTSRVYPVRGLLSIALEETASRFEIAAAQATPGVGLDGIAEAFPLEGARTPYGATKLAAELLVGEYVDAFGLRAVVNRCGVIAGPWQMGKVDQGVFTYWLLAHFFRRPLRYIGFGGSGKQVRDVLHVADLTELVEDQLVRPDHWAGMTLNVGGGRASSLSLRETTELCAELTGNRVDVATSADERPGDVPLYISDCSRVFGLSAWRPRRGPREILEDTLEWARAHEVALGRALSLT